MRSKSLITRIGAAFLAVVILASMGFTTFAAEIGSSNAGEDKVSATVTVTEIAEGYGFYNVAVNYTNNSTSLVGVTMLAYAETANDGTLEESDIADGYTENGLQIVGIDQTEVLESGTFNFLVDTNPDSTNSGAIRMNRGSSGIVLLSADAATAPTGYLFTIPAATAFTATSAVAENITVPYGTTLDEAIELLKALNITVSDDNGNSEQNWTATEWAITDYNGEVASAYEATGSALQGPEDSNATAEGVTVTVTVTVDAAPAGDAWVATKGTLADAISVTVTEGDDALAAIKAALAGKVITVADATDAYTAQVVVTEAIANTLAVDGDAYKVTVAAGTAVTNATAGTTATIANAFDVTFAVTVETIPGGGEEPEVFVATSAEAVDANGAVVTSIEVDNGTSETDAKAKLPTAAKLYNEGKSESMDWTIASWTIAGYNATTAGDYTATATLTAPADSTVDISGVAPITVKVTVKAAAGGEVVDAIPGDVNGNNKVQANDMIALKSHLIGSKVLDLDDPVVLKRADVNGNKKVQANDMIALKAILLSQ